MRKNIEKNKKQKMKKLFLTGLILAEGLLLSCERGNITNENKKEKIKVEIETVKKNYEDIMVDISEKYVKVPNTNLEVKKTKDEIYIKEGDKEHKAVNSYSKAFELDGILYLIGVREGVLQFLNYEINNMEHKFIFGTFLMEKHKNIISHSIYIDEDWLVVDLQGKSGKIYKEYSKTRLSGLTSLRDFHNYVVYGIKRPERLTEDNSSQPSIINSIKEIQ